VLSAEFRFEPKPAPETPAGVQHRQPSLTVESNISDANSILSNDNQIGKTTVSQISHDATKSGWRINRSNFSEPTGPVISLPATPNVVLDDQPTSQRFAAKEYPPHFSQVAQSTASAKNLEYREMRNDAQGTLKTSPRSIPAHEPYQNHDSDQARITHQPYTNLPLKSCANFEFHEGLLKASLIRSLAKCGFTIGKWGIGDEEYEYDMEIPKAYSLPQSGLAALLESVEATYLIRGTQNNLDNTIDFEPSRGAILEGMEIKEW
jgi:hypothetical protein